MNAVIKPYLLLLSCSYLLTSMVSASEVSSSLLTTCQQSLTTDKYFATQPGCDQLLTLATQGDSNSYFQLGKLLVDAKHPVRANKRLKKGLFYLLLASDNNHPQAIKKLSAWVKGKMVDGKIPLRYSHYVTYLEMDWILQDQNPQHHYAQYQQWLTLIEQTRVAPAKQTTQTLMAMATDYENGYFLGANIDKALALYKVAAAKNDAHGQYKTGELLYTSNQTAALKYLHQAVANHSSEAMLKLAEHAGCQGNKSQALKWYDRAIKLGNEDAADEKQWLMKNQTPELCEG